jgi:hypothetical protein
VLLFSCHVRRSFICTVTHCHEIHNTCSDTTTCITAVGLSVTLPTAEWHHSEPRQRMLSTSSRTFMSIHARVCIIGRTDDRVRVWQGQQRSVPSLSTNLPPRAALTDQPTLCAPRRRPPPCLQCTRLLSSISRTASLCAHPPNSVPQATAEPVVLVFRAVPSHVGPCSVRSGCDRTTTEQLGT